MRIWDIHPGYLNRQSLLGEHRELHGIISIIVNNKKGYANHPETKRWSGYGWALRMRHEILACEMALRGYTEKSPATIRFNKGKWPDIFLDSPERQFRLLREKYTGKEEGRIPLPGSLPQLWSQHKYSVLARNQELYKQAGRDVASKAIDFSGLSMLLTKELRKQPTVGGIRNAAQHMWGYVSDGLTDIDALSLEELLSEIQKRTGEGVPYIRSSTALSDLMAWLPTA